MTRPSGRALSPAQQALLTERLRGRRPASAAGGPIPRAPDGPVPLSPEQEQLYYHGMLAARPIYNEAISIRRSGPLDVEALRTALRALIARHDMWHTVFTSVAGKPRQVLTDVPELPLPLLDLTGLPEPEQEARISAVFAEEARRRFDLRRGPLLRPLLVRLGEQDHRLYLALHHLIFDGVSLYRMVLPELAALYDAAVAGTEPALPAPEVRYRDYAAWSRSAPVEAELAGRLPFWREHLAGAPALALPLDRPRGGEPSHRGAIEGFTVPEPVVAALRTFAAARGATLFHVLTAAYASLLARLTGQDDIVFATVADRRNRPELQNMVGYCLTPVPLRLAVPAGATVRDLVAPARAELLEVLSHVVPFERLIRSLDLPRQEGANPLFQAMLVLEPPGAPPPPGWSLHQLDPALGTALGHAKVDVHIELDQRPEGHLAGRFLFNPDLFDADFGARVVPDLLHRLRDTANGDVTMGSAPTTVLPPR